MSQPDHIVRRGEMYFARPFRWTTVRERATRYSAQRAGEVAAEMNEDSGDVFYHGEAVAEPAVMGAQVVAETSEPLRPRS